MERAAFIKEYGEKKYRNLIQGGSGAFGNAATRHGDLRRQGRHLRLWQLPRYRRAVRRSRRQSSTAPSATELLHRMQQLVHERTVYAPLWQLGFLNGQGPRVGRIRLRPDLRPSVFRALRRSPPEGRRIAGDRPWLAPLQHHAPRRSRSFRGRRDRRRCRARPARRRSGELRIGSHVSLAPTWFDPAETAGIITPFMMLYAMHDAMVKAMPDNPMAPCLAEVLDHGARTG